MGGGGCRVPGRMLIMNISDATLNFGGWPLVHEQHCACAHQPTNYCRCPPPFHKYTHPPSSPQRAVGNHEGVSVPGPDPLGSHYTTAGPSHTSAEATPPVSSHLSPHHYSPPLGQWPSITYTYTHTHTILVRLRAFLCVKLLVLVLRSGQMLS